jgi:hypothetical protein
MWKRGKASLSKTTTRCPRLRRKPARAEPPGPAPITATSVSIRVDGVGLEVPDGWGSSFMIPRNGGRRAMC